MIYWFKVKDTEKRPPPMSKAKLEEMKLYITNFQAIKEKIEKESSS
jgi:hypothetical protein